MATYVAGRRSPPPPFSMTDLNDLRGDFDSRRVPDAFHFVRFVVFDVAVSLPARTFRFPYVHAVRTLAPNVRAAFASGFARVSRT